MLSNTRTNIIYSDSAAQARGTICLLARVQSPKHEENLHWNSVAQSHYELKNVKIRQQQ